MLPEGEQFWAKVFGAAMNEDEQNREIAKLRAENTQLKQRVAELEAALRPFIEPEGKQLTRPRSDHEQVPVVVTWGEYRRARAALKRQGV